MQYLRRSFTFCFLLFILISAPVFFGSTHPVIQGILVGLILLFAGAAVWKESLSLPGRNKSIVLGLLLFFFIIFQSIPLPLGILHFLSPIRASWIEAVNALANAEVRFSSISYNGIVSLFDFALYFSLIPLYVLACTVFSGNHGRSRYRIVCVVLVLVGVLEAVYGLLQFVNPKIGMLWLPIPSRAAHGTVIYTNHYGALLNLCWPQAWGLAVYHLAKDVQRPLNVSRLQGSIFKKFVDALSLPKEAYTYFFAAAVMMAAVVLSLSRGAMIALVMVWLTLQFMIPLPRKNRATVFSLFFCFFLLLHFFFDFTFLWGRFQTIGDSGLTRLQLYAASLPIACDHWLTGAGLGAYTALSPLYLKNFPASVHFDHAHNEYIELAIELGLPVTMALLGVLVWYLMHNFGLARRLRGVVYLHRSRVVIGLVALISLFGFAVHGVVDFGWRLPVNLYFATILFAQVTVLRQHLGSACSPSAASSASI